MTRSRHRRHHPAHHRPPFIFGFSEHTLALVVYVVIGAGGLLATLLTRFESDLQPATAAAHAPHPA